MQNKEQSNRITQMTSTQVKQGWRKVKIGDICKEYRQIYEPNNEEVLSYIGMEHVEQQTLRIANIGKSSDTQSSKYKFNAGDILFGKLRPYFRKVVLPKFDGVCSTEFAVIRSNHEYEQSFVYYVLANSDFIDAISNTAQGTRMPRAKWDVISEIEIRVPNLKIQQKIASILSAFDDLIENNTKRIKMLENTAQLIYKEWFVDFKFPNHEKVKMLDSGTEFGDIPEGWEVKKLGDLITVKKGKNITKNTIVDGKVPVVAGGLTPAYYHNAGNTNEPVVTVSASGANSGFVNLYQESIWASDCSFIDKTITEYVYFYYLFLKINQELVTGLQRGSAQPHVYPKDLMQLKIVAPPTNIIRQFSVLIESIFLNLKFLQRENEKLKQIRDLLLPKLVSGEIEVDNLTVK